MPSVRLTRVMPFRVGEKDAQKTISTVSCESQGIDQARHDPVPLPGDRPVEDHVGGGHAAEQARGDPPHRAGLRDQLLRPEPAQPARYTRHPVSHILLLYA